MSFSEGVVINNPKGGSQWVIYAESSRDGRGIAFVTVGYTCKDVFAGQEPFWCNQRFSSTGSSAESESRRNEVGTGVAHTHQEILPWPRALAFSQLTSSLLVILSKTDVVV